MRTIEEIISMVGIKGKCIWEPDQGLFMISENKSTLIANFFPVVKDIQDIEERKVIVLEVRISSGGTDEIQVDIKKLRCLDWFEASPKCVVYIYEKKEYAFLKQIVRIQVAKYMDGMSKTTYYKELGWNVDVFGNPVYVLGNMAIGGDRNALFSPTLSKFEFEYDAEGIEEAVQDFTEILKETPLEGAITLGYFFAGLIKSLFNEANVPSNFVLYLFGMQQNRKTTLAKLTNNLYCRSSDMEFAVRTVEKTSAVVAEKESNLFKDTTLILDDVSATNDAEYRKVQESIVEKVTRFVGNNSRKNVNYGADVKEYFPNASIVFTGEYIPCFSESTLSRMLFVEMWNPCCDEWLSKLEGQPLLLSTVAYDFIAWIQVHYDEVVNSTHDMFEYYRKNQVTPNYQNRLHEHGFVIQFAYKLLFDYLHDKNLIDVDLRRFFNRIPYAIRGVLEEQVLMMKRLAQHAKERDYCKVFVLLYVNKKFSFADNKDDFDEENDEGFYVRKKLIAISSTTLWNIMRNFYEDTSITLNSVVKQFRANGFLEMDKTGKSSKRIGKHRYLHINKDMIQEYAEYFMDKKDFIDMN